MFWAGYSARLGQIHTAAFLGVYSNAIACIGERGEGLCETLKAQPIILTIYVNNEHLFVDLTPINALICFISRARQDGGGG